jgi:hypothetical protein
MVPEEYGCTIPILKVKTLSGRKKAVALPFSDGCDISCECVSADELVAKLLSILKKENISRLEFRGVYKFRPSGEPSHSYYGHRLHLTKCDRVLWEKLSSSKKRNIKKAKLQEIITSFHNEKTAVEQFYNLHCMTRKRLGLPPQPISFFYSIFQNIIAKGRGEIALVKVKNTSIAGALFLFSENEVLYKYGASDKSFQHMRANDILFWESIKRFAENGYKTLNFGKTEKFHEGLCRYKDGFGGMRFELYDYIYNVSTGKKLVDAPMVKGIYNNIFRIMPIPMLRFCGKLLYKYSA